MHRTDTTARKWNASRPTYDEDWSDEDSYDADRSAVVSTQRQSIVQPKARTIRPPWEPQSEENLAEMAKSGPTEAVSSEPTPALAEIPVSHDSMQDRGATDTHRAVEPSESSIKNQETTPPSQEPLLNTVLQGNNRALQHISEPPAATLVEKEVESRTAHGSQPLVPTHSSEYRELNPRTHPISTQNIPVSHSRNPSEKSDIDEDIRLQALMFNPDQLPYDMIDEPTEHKSGRHEVIPTTRDPSPVPDRTLALSDLANGLNDHEATSVPSYPQDFAGELKSRALSDTLLETMQLSPKPDLERSNSSEDLRSKTPVTTAERTPSILLTTNTWAEKNRLLKEQLEQNKRQKELEQSQQAANVRASTYDHEYDYAPAMPRAPHTRQIRQAPQAQKSPQMSQIYDDYYQLDPQSPDPPSTTNYLQEPVNHPTQNLNTLVEENEEETATEENASLSPSTTISKAPVSRPHTPRVPIKLDSPVRAVEHEEAVRPSSAKSFDTHKSLPPIRRQTPDIQIETDASSISGSYADSADDNVVSADQEFALIQQAQSSTATSEANLPPHNKELPPIVQISDSPSRNTVPTKRSSLPEIETRAHGERLAQAEEYTPSLYSAAPSGIETTHADLEDKRPAGQVHSAPDTTVEQVDSSAERNQQSDLEPLSAKSWQPLRATPRNSVVENTPREVSRFSMSGPNTPVALESSRFSTSTTQSVEKVNQDDYRFDMRDSFNPAVLGDLHDSPYLDDDDDEFTEEQQDDMTLTVDQAKPFKHPNPSESQANLRPSASAITLQPPLRHARSIDSHLSASTEVPGTIPESERLADELLRELTPNGGTVSSSVPETKRYARRISNTVTEDALSETNVVSDSIAPQKSPTTQYGTPQDQREVLSEVMGPKAGHMLTGMRRNRSDSSATMFLEVMSPMTSMEQERFVPGITGGKPAMTSTMMMQYKDIKQLPTSTQRTTEYTRRAKALNESSNGLKEYLLEIQTRLQQQGRDLPKPVAHVEYKPSKSIIPDKFVPHDLTRSTARLGDRGKDAAKGLLSKSSKGIKGLFHSNSRSVSSGSYKKDISSPMEVNGPNRTASMLDPGSRSPMNRQKAHQPMQFDSRPKSPPRLEQSRTSNTTATELIGSPVTYRSSTPSNSNSNRLSQQSPLRGEHPVPQSPKRNDPTVSRIQSYFPTISAHDIEQALNICDGDEQKTIGYLVVHGVR